MASAEKDHGGHDPEDLNKKSQNPGAPLLSFPVQLNFNGGVGPEDRTQLLMNLQPVLPVSFDEHLSLVTRWIIPVMGQPGAGTSDSTWGLGDVNAQIFLAYTFDKVTLAAGPTILVPTATAAELGAGKLTLGPALLGVVSPGPFVLGVLGTFNGSVAGDDARDDVALLTIQPFVNLNLPLATYVVTAPQMFFDLEGEQNTVPVGGGVGKLFNLAGLPTNMNVQAYANVVHPDAGPTWQFRLTMAFLFPPKPKAADAKH